MKYDLDFFRGQAWDPFREFASLQKRMSRFFEEGTAPSLGLRDEEKKWLPACNIDENENQYLVTVDLPGVTKDNVKVEFHDGALVISGEKHSEWKEDSARGAVTDRDRGAHTRHLEERATGTFRRWFMLPGEIDASRIQASFENGVLRITAPKTAAEKPKQIPISEGAAARGGPSATRVAS